MIEGKGVLNTDNAGKSKNSVVNSKSVNNMKVMRLISHFKDIKDEKTKEKILKLYYNQSGSLRTSVPYVTEKDIQNEDYKKKQEKKWLNNKGIAPTLKQLDANYVTNDVNYNLPYGKPIAEYKYRDSGKNTMFS